MLLVALQPEAQDGNVTESHWCGLGAFQSTFWLRSQEALWDPASQDGSFWEALPQTQWAHQKGTLPLQAL